MRVVVTGGSGRLGQFVLRELFTHAHQVAALDTTKPRECPCPTYTADLTKGHTLQDLFKDVDAVVHLARQRFPYNESGFNTGVQRWEFPDTNGEDPVDGTAPIPVRRSQALRNVVPRAAADHALAAIPAVLSLPCTPVRRRSVIIPMPTVFDPFPNIAAHVM
ncbi:MAG TPA: NAD-dependent epimerase/dehydratase family protein [Candidatus Saccharimonadales bacterium]|nr:NAD-dependent epimerase/dehydratase family protein [Candidatus Saccharimonadales bacterium]